MAEKVQPSPSERSRPWPVRDLELLNKNLGSHWKLTCRQTLPCVWMSLLKLQRVVLQSQNVAALDRGWTAPIPCTFSTADCTKLTMVANSTLIGAL